MLYRRLTLFNESAVSAGTSSWNSAVYTRKSRPIHTKAHFDNNSSRNIKTKMIFKCFRVSRFNYYFKLFLYVEKKRQK